MNSVLGGLVFDNKAFFLESLKDICKEYHERLFLCESQKWDLEYEVRKRDYEV